MLIIRPLSSEHFSSLVAGDVVFIPGDVVLIPGDVVLDDSVGFIGYRSLIGSRFLTRSSIEFADGRGSIENS